MLLAHLSSWRIKKSEAFPLEKEAIWDEMLLEF